MEPGEMHTTTHVSAPASFFVVWWAPQVLADAGAELGLRTPIHFTYAQSASLELSSSLEALCVALSADPDPLTIATHFADATRQLLLGEVEQKSVIRCNRRRHPTVRRAVDYLRAAFSQNVSLDDLARAARVSKFHLARSFRASTGLAPHQYQTLLRLNAARRHLERGATVDECAALTGFADGSHLTRAFRKWVGVGPGSWARAAKCASVALAAGPSALQSF
jgi:AraC-like DNA-binding protein